MDVGRKNGRDKEKDKKKKERKGDCDVAERET